MAEIEVVLNFMAIKRELYFLDALSLTGEAVL